MWVVRSSLIKTLVMDITGFKSGHWSRCTSDSSLESRLTCSIHGNTLTSLSTKSSVCGAVAQPVGSIWDLEFSGDDSVILVLMGQK